MPRPRYPPPPEILPTLLRQLTLADWRQLLPLLTRRQASMLWRYFGIADCACELSGGRRPRALQVRPCACWRRQPVPWSQMPPEIQAWGRRRGLETWGDVAEEPNCPPVLVRRLRQQQRRRCDCPLLGRVVCRHQPSAQTLLLPPAIWGELLALLPEYREGWPAPYAGILGTPESRLYYRRQRAQAGFALWHPQDLSV
jgi:hypothetical protein